MKIKTIDVQAKEWRDKINGNSYCSARVTVNYGTKSQFTLFVPYQYGYGTYYEQAAGEALNIPKNKMLWSWCRENKIILRSNIERGQLKRDVVAWGKAPSKR